MRRPIAWAILILVTAFTALVLFNTEVHYLAFIDALRSLKLTVQDAKLHVAHSDETVRMHLVLLIENPVAENVFLEEISYRLCTGAQFYRVCPSAVSLGAYYSLVGSGKLAKGQLVIPIEETVEARYRDRLKGATAVNILGQARLKFQIGDTQLKFALEFKELLPWPP